MARPFQNVIYLRIRRRWLGIQVITFMGRYGGWAGVPEVVFARDRQGREQAFAPDDPMLVTLSGHRTFTAFSHPRVLIACFDETLRTLEFYLRLAGPRGKLVRGTLVVQICDEWQGGLTDVEWRALVELCRSSAAKTVIPVESDRELSTPELLQIAKRGVRPGEAIVRC